MHEYVSFNGKILAANEAAIPAVSSAALYSKGVFTTVAVRDWTPTLWERHWARLRENARRLRLDISFFTEEAILLALNELLKRNNAATGMARLTFFDERAGKPWAFDTGRTTGLFIITKEAPLPADIRLTISPFRINTRSPLSGVKSCNYLENIIPLNHAKEGGFDEAVRLNERDQIASGCMANIFWKKDGRLFTPSLASGCLPGTTRGELIDKEGAVEMDAGIEALENADEIYLTSAGLGKARVSEFEGKVFNPKVFF